MLLAAASAVQVTLESTTLFELHRGAPLQLSVVASPNAAAAAPTPLLLSALTLATVANANATTPVRECRLRLCIGNNNSTCSAYSRDAVALMLGNAAATLPLGVQVAMATDAGPDYCRFALTASAIASSSSGAAMNLSVGVMGAAAISLPNVGGGFVRADLCGAFALNESLLAGVPINGSAVSAAVWLALGGVAADGVVFSNASVGANGTLPVGASVHAPFAVLDRELAFDVGSATAGSVAWPKASAQISLLLAPLPLLLDGALPLLNQTGAVPAGAGNPLTGLPPSTFRVSLFNYALPNASVTLVDASAVSHVYSLRVDGAPAFACNNSAAEHFEAHLVTAYGQAGELGLENSLCFLDAAPANRSLLVASECTNGNGSIAFQFHWNDDCGGLANGGDLKLVVTLRSAALGAFVVATDVIGPPVLGDDALLYWSLTTVGVIVGVGLIACIVNRWFNRRQARFARLA